MNGVTINAQDKTVAQVVSEINASSAGVSATLEEHNDSSGSYKTIVLKKTADSESASKFSVSASGDFARVAGLGDYSTASATTTKSSVVSGNNTVGGTNTVAYDRISEEQAKALGFTVIKTAADLQNIKKTGNYILMNDIDLSSLGTLDKSLLVDHFEGTLDGNGYTLSNLTINSTEDSVGLFGEEFVGRIANLNIDNINITGAKDVGVICGTTTDDNKSFGKGEQTISNVHVTNSSVSSTSGGYTGGFIGSIWQGFASISDSSFEGNITSTTFATGGIVGYIWAGCSISSCYVNANITTSSSYTGGIVGDAEGTTIQQCIAEGIITCSSGAGIAGSLSYSEINNCIAKNTITGADISGLCDYGLNYSEINNSYFDGKLITTGDKPAGGLVGSLNYDEQYDQNYITNCFWNIENSGATEISRSDTTNNDITNSTGLTSSEFANAANFSSWDSNIWDFSGSTPQLKNVSKPVTISAGTVQINGHTINLSGGSIDDTIAQINAQSSSTGVTAAIEGGKVVFNNTSGTDLITVEAGTSDFVDITGTESLTTTTNYEKLYGSTAVTSKMQTSGYISQNSSQTETLTISSSAGSFNVTINSGEALNTVIDKINAANGGVTASIENGKLIFAYGANATNVSVSSTGDFTKFYGLKDTQSTWEWTEAAGGMSQTTTSEIDPDAPTDPTDPDNPGGGDPTDPDPDNPDDPPLNINNLVTEGISNIRLQVGDSSSEHCVLRCDTTFVFDDFSLDFSTAESSADCVEGLQDFQKAITAKISTIGVYTSRLEAIQSHNLVKHENLTSAYSTIVDADIAEETTKYIKNQIVQQTSQALMAQAKKVQIERVMTLIGSISGL